MLQHVKPDDAIDRSLGWVSTAPPIGVASLSHSSSWQRHPSSGRPWRLSIRQATLPGLQRPTTPTGRTTFLLSLPVGLGMIFFGRWFPASVRAAVYGGGRALSILATGQLVNVDRGPVGAVMMMTGHERVAMRVMTFTAITNLGVSAILIPIWGLLGAAVGAFTSVIIWNVLLVWEANRHLV